MSHLNRRQLRQLREILVQEKNDLQKHFDLNDHYGLSQSLRENTGELSTNDNHPADVATELYDRSKDIAINENAEYHLLDVNEALNSMDDGSYGTCSICGTNIPFERLMAIPTTHYCKKHAPDRHASERRPVEEQILAPPFGRTSLDELDEQNQFDGEDAWQIVESWGTSNTPAMAEDREVHSYNEMEIEHDENDGYVESFESFLATDMFGSEVSVVRNKAYREYMHSREGEGLLEPDEDYNNLV